MLKLLGAVMIVGACTLMGISIDRRLCDRVRILQELISILQEMKAEIVFRSAPVSSIFQQIASKPYYFTAIYFQEIYNNLQVFGVQSAAEYAMKELYKLPLTENDIRQLGHTFDAIGRYDAPTQAEALSRSILSLEQQLAEARVQQSQKGKLYRAVGFSCGVALALIAI